MHADLDFLCIAVYCTADDLLPEPSNNRRRQLTDAEVVTLAVAQVAMGAPSDRRFLWAARRQLGHLFKALPSQSAFHKRRVRLRETIEWLSGVFANSSPGSRDNMLLLDSAPVECGKSIDTSRRSQLADACGYGYCAAHSRRPVAHFASYGIRVERVMTDNASAYRSAVHALACRALRIRHLRTPALPATDQRQSRALHPHNARQLGLRGNLRKLRGAPARSPWLARLLQSAATTRQPQPPSAHRAATHAHKEQPGWVLHLAPAHREPVTPFLPT